MRLVTFIPPGPSEARAGEVRDSEVVAFAGGSTVLDRLETGDLSPASGPSWPLDDVTLLAPIPRPGAIYCIGLNYAAHAAETGAQPPEQPIVFTKVPTAIAPPGGPVRCPAVVTRLDYEGELVVVIGPDGGVGGYAVADDVSARDLQGREPQWTRAKGARTFCPWGPWITTPDEVADPEDLRLRTWVNGELRQDSSTRQLIFDCFEQVAHLSSAFTLEPGDIITTGTPGGVGALSSPPRFLTVGDVVKIEIDGVGTIENRVIAEPEDTQLI